MKTLLFNPFERYSENKLLIIGVIATIIGTYLASVFNFRFNGVLEAHLTTDLTFKQSFIDNLINISSLIVFFYCFGKYMNIKTRFVDIIAIVIISRTPYYLLPLLNIKNIFLNATNEIKQIKNSELLSQISISNVIILIVFAIISILMLIWYIALLYNGFKIATNAKKKSSTIFFIVALIAAEILSLVLIHYLN